MANSIIGGNSTPSATPNGLSSATPALPDMTNLATTDMLKQFQEFSKNFKGDPKQIVMQMLSQGKIGNSQLQQIMQMAKQFEGFLK